MTTEDSISDEVFVEETGTGQAHDFDDEPTQCNALNVQEAHGDERTPSPSGYPGYKPPREALQMYAVDTEYYFNAEKHGRGSERKSRIEDDGEPLDDWKSYKIEDEDSVFDESMTHKTILLGDSGVGKTSFLVKYNTGDFKAGSFSATVGVALTNKIVAVDQTRVKLQIWDTAGQERFRSVTHAYYRDAHALLLLYDVTNKLSFDNIRAWLGEIREYAQEDVVIMLLGNKADCGYERQVKLEDGERLAREYNVAFMETSAKTGLNVELAFLAVARQLKSRRSDSIDDSKFNVQEFVREQTHKQTCPPCNM